MKLVAKHTELVQFIQKFVPRSHDGIFHNKCTQSTPLDPKLMFRSVLLYLGSFRNCMKLGAKHTELVQLIHKFMPRSHVVIFRNKAPDPPHWTLNSCFGVFHSVWVHLGSFRSRMKLGAKYGELVQLMLKFAPRSDVGIFCNEHTQSTPLDLCSILVHLGLFRNSMKLGAKRGELEQLMQKFVPRSDVGIFCNGQSQSTQLYNKVMFRYVS